MSLLGAIRVEAADSRVEIVVGTVILDYTPTQAALVAEEILAAARQAERSSEWRTLR